MSTDPDDIDLIIAIGCALGLPVEDAVQAAGLTSRNTYYLRRDKHPEFYEKIRLVVEPLALRTIAVQVGAHKAALSAEEMIALRFQSAIQITDRLIEQFTGDDNAGRCSECGRLSEAKVAELMEAHKHIVKWSSEFAASKAPTRVKHEGAVTHSHVLMLDDTVRDLIDFRAHLGGIQPLALPPAPPEATEAEVVG